MSSASSLLVACLSRQLSRPATSRQRRRVPRAWLPYQDGRRPHGFLYVAAHQQSPQEAQDQQGDEGGADDAQDKLCAPCERGRAQVRGGKAESSVHVARRPCSGGTERLPWCGPLRPRGQEAEEDPHPARPPLPWLPRHLLPLVPVVTHCSLVRVVRVCRLATLGSTLMQYSVSQKRLLMLNSGVVSSTLYCKDQSVGWYLRAPSSCGSAGPRAFLPPPPLSPGESPQGA